METTIASVLSEQGIIEKILEGEKRLFEILIRR